jgi:NADPH:quinone reductase-like Zn-dependent oxidoreductase
VQGEFAVYPSQYVAPWPEGFSAEQACSVWMQYLTAYFALLEVGKAGVGDFVLIPAASSSAGLGAIQLVTDAGATAIATTRTEEKKQFILRAGADHVVITEREDLARRIDEITDDTGVRLVYDPVGGAFLKTYVDALARHATIFLYGLLSGEPTEVEVVPMVRKAAVLHPYSMFNHVGEPAQLARAKNYIQERLGDGRLTPLVDRVFDFEQVVEAYQYMESNQQKGKIVVKV